MSEFVQVEPPLDLDRLKVAVPDVKRVQFNEPLADKEYQALGELLELHPHVALRVYGFSAELASLGFLRWFPKLRRFSADGLSPLADASGLNTLPDDVEVLDIGETSKPLDLRPLKFAKLQTLGINGHQRGLPELVNRNQGLQALSLWRLKLDQALPKADLPKLESLALSLGSLNDAGWLSQFSSLRFLALRRVRGISDLGPVSELSKLEWLWLEALPGVTHLPDLSANNSLVRVDLNELKSLKDDNALNGMRAAPNLDEVDVTSTPLSINAFESLAQHARLSAINVGTGNERRNKEIAELFDRPRPRSIWRFAESQGIPLVM